MLIVIDCQPPLAWVQFSYDPDLVAVIKTVPGRRWRPEYKYWTIPVAQVDGCAYMFYDEGCTVLVDGSLWSPTDHLVASLSSGGRVELLLRFFEALPPHLQAATHRALVKVWHPDAGGDHSLAQDLNLARSSLKEKA